MTTEEEEKFEQDSKKVIKAFLQRKLDGERKLESMERQKTVLSRMKEIESATLTKDFTKAKDKKPQSRQSTDGSN